jgi:GT2 family glycosyltransferase
MIAYANHLQLFYRLGKEHPDWVVIINTPRRMSIDRMRNMCAKVALELECDYLMFIDDDVIVPIGAIEQLMKADCDIAAGWTIIRGHPFENMFFKFDDKGQLRNYEIERSNPGEPSIVDVDAVGFSCALIKCSILKKIRPPYFVTGPYNTEDIYFCIKARETIPDCTIVVDSIIETAHIMGPQIMAPWNRVAYAEYYDKAEKPPEAVLVGDKTGDRTEVYRKEMENAFS